MNVREFLRESHRPFEVLEHPTTYSARGMAQAVHMNSDEVIKPVILRADGQYVMALVPATCRVDLQKAREALHAKTLEMAHETDLSRLFPDCERGARPPFGSQYGMRTMVDERLAQDEQIVFEGNTHRETIRMSFREFADLEHPQAADLADRH